MGTYTEFRGAIRIVPKVDDALAARLNEFFEMRHMKRYVAELFRLYPTAEAQRAHSLFNDGQFGVEGAWFMPEHTRDLFFHGDQMPMEGLRNDMDVNTPPHPLPSLYCDLVLVHDEERNCSYLGWSGAEKAYFIAEWIERIAAWLVDRHYHLDGKMFAIVEGGMQFYTITVRDRSVFVADFEPESTYAAEFNGLYDRY